MGGWVDGWVGRQVGRWAGEMCTGMCQSVDLHGILGGRRLDGEEGVRVERAQHHPLLVRAVGLRGDAHHGAWDRLRAGDGGRRRRQRGQGHRLGRRDPAGAVGWRRLRGSHEQSSGRCGDRGDVHGGSGGGGGRGGDGVCRDCRGPGGGHHARGASGRAWWLWRQVTVVNRERPTGSGMHALWRSQACISYKVL